MAHEKTASHAVFFSLKKSKKNEKEEDSTKTQSITCACDTGKQVEERIFRETRWA